MKNLIDIENIDSRLGYKLVRRNQEAGHFRFIGGEWKFRTGSMPWSKVGNQWALAAQLKAWDEDEECAVIFWQCCGANCKTPETHELAKEILKAGGSVTHGYCDACAALVFAEIEAQTGRKIAA